MVFSLRARLLPQHMHDKVPLPNRQGQSVERAGDHQVEGPPVSLGFHPRLGVRRVPHLSSEVRRFARYVIGVYLCS
jgi:hypothetical protein